MTSKHYNRDRVAREKLIKEMKHCFSMLFCWLKIKCTRMQTVILEEAMAAAIDQAGTAEERLYFCDTSDMIKELIKQCGNKYR